MKKPIENQNRIIEHDFTEATLTEALCECCNEKFKFYIYPSVFVYPKYCAKHINPYQRALFISRKLPK